MTKRKFKNELKRGLGSALIELEQNKDSEEYKDIVLWCCLHVTSYDAQCEGDRYDYLFQAIETFGDISYFVNPIIERFEKKNIDLRLFSQLCGLSVCQRW